MPNYNFQTGDIAIVVALLLFGFSKGITVAFFNMIVTMTIFYGPGGIVGPPYYFIAVFCTLLGVYVASRLAGSKKLGTRVQFGVYPVVLLTAAAIVIRVLVMLPLDYNVYPTLVSIISGLSVAESTFIVVAAMPGIVVYNIAAPIFAIPISYIMAKKIVKSLKPNTFAPSTPLV